MERGTVVLAVLPFTDLSGQKRRPAVIISPENPTARDVLIAFVTSYKGEPLLTTDLMISKGDPDFQKTGSKKIHSGRYLRHHQAVTDVRGGRGPLHGKLMVHFVPRSDRADFARKTTAFERSNWSVTLTLEQLMSQITVSLPEDRLRKLEEIAARFNVSAQELVRGQY